MLTSRESGRAADLAEQIHTIRGEAQALQQAVVAGSGSSDAALAGDAGSVGEGAVGGGVTCGVDTAIHLDRAPWPAVLPPGVLPRDFIAGYQFCREIHRGGQGVVYEATQIATCRRVAIKLIYPPARTTAADRHRFEREAELLTDLQHPNVVTVHDAGVIDGVCYLVMDFVAGVPIDRYVSRLRDDPAAVGGGGAGRGGRGGRRAAERALRGILELFASVCDGVNAAHQKGILHRDLKPSNILVVEPQEVCNRPEVVCGRRENPGAYAARPGGEDGRVPGRAAGPSPARPRPMLLDFGLAKQIGEDDQDSSDATVTLTGQFLGSLPWASPEQAARRHRDVDIRTDVYSLGVLLYNLLTGTFPYEIHGSFREVTDRIVHAEPVRPRPVPALGQRLNHDVETIVLKCLAKEPGRRYSSAGDLGEDIRRHLTGTPIEARRASAGYVLWKIAWRHRFWAGSIGAVLAVATLGGLASFALWRQAVKERDSARAHMGVAVQALHALLAGMATSDGFIAKEMLDNEHVRHAVHQVDHLTEQIARLPSGGPPEAAVELHSALLWLNRSVGRFDKAAFHLGQAIAAARAAYGNYNEHLAILLLSGGYVYDQYHDRATILNMAEEALAIRRRLCAADSAPVTEALTCYASALFVNGCTDQALQSMRAALAQPQISDRALANTLKLFAEHLYDLRRYDDAVAMHAGALALARQACEPAQLAHHLHSFAVLQRTAGNLEEAQQMAEEALAIRRVAYQQGECAEYFLYSSMGLAGSIRAAQGDLEGGAVYLEEAIRQFDPPRWDSHTLRVRQNFIQALVRLYDDWHAAQPEMGYQEKADEWRQRLTLAETP